MSECARAIYPGSFDPVTLGHLDLVRRAARIFDGGLVVAVLRNTTKSPLFSPEERREMFAAALADEGIGGVRVISFEGLLVDVARREGAKIILRGLRAVSDFEFELQMAMMNRRLAPGIETVFLTPGEDVSFISSRLVREIARLGGDVSGLVPRAALARLVERFGPAAAGE